MAPCRMLNQIPRELVDWKNNMAHEVNRLFPCIGHLPSLLNITPNVAIVQALLEFWDPDSSVFRFGECELTLTLEEIEGLLQVPGKGHPMVYPMNGTREQFCKFLGLKQFSMSQHPDVRSCPLEFLYKRFGEKESYDHHHEDFFVSREQWEEKRVLAFGITLINLLLFPKKHGKVTFSTVNMVQSVFLGIRGKTPTLVPVIIADIFAAVTECRKKRGFFYASNLVLQIWVMEHLSKRTLNPLGSCLPTANWVESHRERVRKYYRIESPSLFIQEFNALTSDKIQWVLDWTKVRDPAFRTTQLDFIPLASTGGLIVYVPQRVMRQFGYPQRVPTIQRMGSIELNTVTECQTMVLEAWGNLCSLDNLHLDQVNKVEPKVVLEYNEWIKSIMEQGRERASLVSLSLEEQNEKLRKELENRQLQIMVADQALEDARSQLKKEAKKTENLEKALSAFGKIQDEIRKLSIGSSRESQHTKLARHEDFVRMVSRTINEIVKKD
ncbi:uncharacterized protein [Coffea arabica]|uniref:DUF7745 domain-containing protein n=1 Tax=Coffea arabica TaxID=13443 RepID=A0A6P6VGZ7_COFAR